MRDRIIIVTVEFTPDDEGWDWWHDWGEGPPATEIITDDPVVQDMVWHRMKDIADILDDRYLVRPPREISSGI